MWVIWIQATLSDRLSALPCYAGEVSEGGGVSL